MTAVAGRTRPDGGAFTGPSVASLFDRQRLTLNILPSFAQFEREVTSERIRDKVAASKARGMWMGGSRPWATT